MKELKYKIKDKIISCIKSDGMLDEERISNKDAAEKVRNRENFVGSHTYGEDLGELGKMYVAYSYGEQHPLYVWIKRKDSDDSGIEGTWYYNEDAYLLPDGSENIWTKKHLVQLRPNNDVQARTKSYLKGLVARFKADNGIVDNSHSDLKPGEK